MNPKKGFCVNSASKIKKQVVVFLLVPLLLLLLLIIPMPGNHAGRVMHAWWDFAHVPVFAIIAWSLLFLFRRHWLLIGLALFFMVPVIEWAQGFTGREQAIADIYYGWAGCLAGGLLATAISSSKVIRIACCVIAAAVLTIAMVYPLRLGLENVRVRMMFPILSLFDSPLEQSRWKINGCEIDDRNDGWKITIIGDAEYPGLFLNDQVGDWSAMTGLSIHVFLEGDQPLEMWVRVDDQAESPSYYNRFQKPVLLQPGPNTVTVDRKSIGLTTGGRIMNLNNIHAFGIFFSRKDAGRVIRLTKIEVLPNSN